MALTLALCHAQAPNATPPPAPRWTLALPKPDAAQWSPITHQHRLATYGKSLINPATFLGAAASAGISQGRGTPHEWPQGMEGYGHRVGNALAKTAIRSTVRFGLSVALHEDLRYISSGKPRTPGRVWYALSSTFTSFNHEGHRRFSVAKFTANAGASALSRTWSPPSWQGGRNIAGDFAITTLVQAGFNLGREFAPDILNSIRNRGPRGPSSPTR